MGIGPTRYFSISSPIVVHDSMRYFWCVVNGHVVELSSFTGVDCGSGWFVDVGVAVMVLSGVESTSGWEYGWMTAMSTGDWNSEDTSVGVVGTTSMATTWGATIGLSRLVVAAAVDLRSQQLALPVNRRGLTWLEHVPDFGFWPTFSRAAAILLVAWGGKTDVGEIQPWSCTIFYLTTHSPLHGSALQQLTTKSSRTQRTWHKGHVGRRWGHWSGKLNWIKLDNT